MSGRSDAAQILKVFRRHWAAFREELRSMEIKDKDKALAWSIATSQISLFIYKSGQTAREKTNV